MSWFVRGVAERGCQRSFRDRLQGQGEGLQGRKICDHRFWQGRDVESRPRPFGILEADFLPALGFQTCVPPFDPAELRIDAVRSSGLGFQGETAPLHGHAGLPGENLTPKKRRRVLQDARLDADVVRMKSE